MKCGACGSDAAFFNCPNCGEGRVSNPFDYEHRLGELMRLMSKKVDREEDYQTLLAAHAFEVARAQKAEAALAAKDAEIARLTAGWNNCSSLLGDAPSRPLPLRKEEPDGPLERELAERIKQDDTLTRWKRAKWLAERERGTSPDWGCRTCGCLWRDNADDSVSLYNQEAKSCAVCEKNTLTACDPLTMLAALTRLEYSNYTEALPNASCANCGHRQIEHRSGQCSGTSSLGACECKYHIDTKLVGPPLRR